MTWAPRSAVHKQRDGPPMGFDDPAGNRQAEPGTSGFRAATALGVEEGGSYVIGHATTVIADRDRHARPVSERAHPHLGALWVVPQRIVHQVEQHLLHAVVVRPDRREPGTVLKHDSLPVERWKAGHGGVDHNAKVAPVAMEPEDPRLDGREVQEVFDQTAEPGRLSGDAGEELLLGTDVPRHVGLQQARSVAPDSRQGCPKLVAQAGQEALLHLLRPAQGGGFLVGNGHLFPLEGQL